MSKVWQAWALKEKDEWGFEFINGPYKDVVLQITKLDFSEADDSALDCEYHTINLPEHLDPEELKSPDFIDTMQVVISEILSDAIEASKEANDY